MTPEDDFHQEHDQEHQGEGEWVSNEPPVDDFGDENAGEAATVSEGDDHEGDEHHDAGIEEKKGFPLILLMGAVASLAVVGGLAYWHFGGHTEQQASLLDAATQNGAHEAAPNFAMKAAAPAEAKIQTAAAAPAPSAPSTAPTTGYSVPTAVVDIPDADKGSQQGSAMPASAMASATTTVPAAQAVAEPMVAKAAAPAEAADDERLNALSSRMDEVQKSLSQTMQQLSEINDKLSSNATAAKPDPAIEQRLDRLEQKITQMEQPAKPAELVLPAQQPAKTASTSAADTTPMTEPAPMVTKKPRHAAAAETKRAFAFRHHKPASASKANRWVLRAATPDEAWIAKNAETRQLRPVHVGDTVDGIGRVTAIEQVGATWVVQGTHGTIR